MREAPRRRRRDAAVFARSARPRKLTSAKSRLWGKLRVAEMVISFSPLDLSRVRPLAERLTSLGYQVALERGPGPARHENIARRIDAAAALIVVWTINSRNSTTVFAEAAQAQDAGKLLQMRLDEIALPALRCACPCRHERGSRRMGAVRTRFAAPRPRRRLAQPRPVRPPGPLATPNALGAPKLVTTALALTLLGYVSATAAAYTGAMTPAQLQVAMTGLMGAAAASAASAPPAAHRVALGG